MQIHTLLSNQTAVVGLPGGDKAAVIKSLVDLLKGHPAIKDLDVVRSAVLDRESVMSTGVGKGLALPHAKTTAVTATVAALAITDAPVDFDALDEEPVRILFLLIGHPDAKSQHVRILSRISRIMNQDAVRESMMEAESGVDLLSILSRREAEFLDG